MQQIIPRGRSLFVRLMVILNPSQALHFSGSYRKSGALSKIPHLPPPSTGLSKACIFTASIKPKVIMIVKFGPASKIATFEWRFI